MIVQPPSATTTLSSISTVPPVMLGGTLTVSRARGSSRSPATTLPRHRRRTGRPPPVTRFENNCVNVFIRPSILAL
jgi:hypothetical protein